MNRGDVFHTRTAGAGGWGSPLDRDPEAVLDDVRNEKLTPEYAKREYGVVIDPDTLQLDHVATRRLRVKMTQPNE